MSLICSWDSLAATSKSLKSNGSAPRRPRPPDTDIEHPRRTAEVALLDRSHPTGADHADQAGIVEDADVIGDGALRPAHRGGDLGHGGRPLVEQAEDRRPEWVADGPHLGRGGELQRVAKVVVGDGGPDIHR